MRHYKTLAFILLILCHLSCANDDSNSNGDPQDQNFDPTSFSQNFGNTISRTFLGNVVDTNNNPIEGVLIKIGSLTAMTDSNGVFIIQNATVKERFGYVTAEKYGFIHASRAVVPSEGTNKITIMMLPETIAGSTSSGAQDVISLANGASVSLEGDYIKEDGSSYSGNVNVIMHHLDPVDENMEVQMPGMLYAANAQNEERMLQTFGMLAVELRGDNGEDLNLAEGSSAEIKVPLDASLLADAPNSIPLWYFDETYGYWIEEGQATLVGNEYVGTVTHFSFWNCDIPAEAVNLCIDVNNEEGSPLANMQVAITSDTFGTRYGITNANGQACGLVPSNEALEINIYYYDICGQSSLFSSSIGPFNVDSVGSITILESLETINETVTGIFNDCNGNPVTNGYVDLRYAGEHFSELVTDGDFEINLLRCDTDDTFRIKAYDYINIQETDSLYYTFTTPLTNLGSIQSCNDVEEFITYQVDDHPVITYNFDVLGGLDGNFLIASYNSQQDPNMSFNLYLYNFNGPDTYNEVYLDFFDSNGDFASSTLESQIVGTTNVSAFGEIGEFIDINFSGVIDDYNSPDEFPISGTIHVRRDY